MRVLVDVPLIRSVARPVVDVLAYIGIPGALRGAFDVKAVFPSINSRLLYRPIP